MKEKLALVIAALLITSMAFAISTTTVTAPSTFSASPSATATLDEPDPARVRANTRMLIKITVTNDSTTDNIDNVRIVATTVFTQAIGGASAAENLELAADNMENAVAFLQGAGENLIFAEDNKKAAGSKLTNAAVDMDTAGGWLNIATETSENIKNAGSNLKTAALNLSRAGDNLNAEPENWDLVASKLSTVSSFLDSAGIYLVENDTADPLDNVLENAGWRLDNAAARISDASTAIAGGSLRRAGENLKLAGENIKVAADNLDEAGTGTNEDNAAAPLWAAGDKIYNAGVDLVNAGNNLDNAGYALGLAENYLKSAGSLIEAADTDLVVAGDNLENAALMLEAAENQLRANTENVQAAGENLVSAAACMASSASGLGVGLGGDEENAAQVHIKAAGDNMKSSDNVDLTVAGNQLIAAASDLEAAAAAMLLTANKLVPITTTWDMSTGADYVQFDAHLGGENSIAPTLSETFGFLWTTPTITTEENYTLGILTSIEELLYTEWDNLGGFTLTVDGKIPTLAIVVTQTGVVDRDNNAVENVVGTALDNEATITITASEELQFIGTVTVENSGGTEENFVSPITLTTTDNRVYTGTFLVGTWDDNVPVVKVASAKDLVGNENDVGMEGSFIVDTRAPVFTDNGLLGLINGMARKNVTQAGTDITFAYVDNNADQNISIFVQDNALGEADNDFWVISVTIDTDDAAPDPTIDDRWFKAKTLSEGLTSVLIVTATDRVGNTVSDNVENIFIDTKLPTITFEDGASITRMIGRTNIIGGEETEVTFSAGVRINDNTPKIEIIISDQGYTSTGIPPALGVARENLIVQLDNDENILNGAFYRILDNKDPWRTQAQIAAGVFENVIENVGGGGLMDGTYYITVWASDNLNHDGENGYTLSRSFILDTVVPNILNVVNPNVTSILDTELMTVIVSPTQETTMLVKGVSDEAESTIYIYVGDNQVGFVQSGTDSKFQVEITLSEGTNVIYFKEVDLAGNESDKELYRTYIVDKTPPVITVTTPVADETTDKAVITVSGTVIDSVAKYDELIVTIDATGTYVAKRVYLNPDGSFSTSVPLVEGSNVINVIAIDTADVQKIASVTVTRTVTPWATYAIIVVIVALLLAAIAIFRKR